MTTIQIVIAGAWGMAIACAIAKDVTSVGMLLAWFFAIAASVYGLMV